MAECHLLVYFVLPDVFVASRPSPCSLSVLPYPLVFPSLLVKLSFTAKHSLVPRPSLETNSAQSYESSRRASRLLCEYCTVQVLYEGFHILCVSAIQGFLFFTNKHM